VDYKVTIIFKGYKIFFKYPWEPLKALRVVFVRFIPPLLCVKFFTCNYFLDM
jgi:hypothetical protein